MKPVPSLQPLAAHDGDVDSDGIVNVDAGQHVGAGVRSLDHGHQGAENILVRIHRRTEIGAVGVDGADDQADGHTDEQEGAQPVEIPLICKKEIQHRPRHIDEPEEVGDDEVLVKRDVVVQSHMDNMIIAGHRPLQIEKPRKVYECVQKNPRMPVFSNDLLHKSRAFPKNVK